MFSVLLHQVIAVVHYDFSKISKANCVRKNYWLAQTFIGHKQTQSAQKYVRTNAHPCMCTHHAHQHLDESNSDHSMVFMNECDALVRGLPKPCDTGDNPTKAPLTQFVLNGGDGIGAEDSLLKPGSRSNYTESLKTDLHCDPANAVTGVVTVSDMLRKAGEQTGIRLWKHASFSDQFFGRADNQSLADAGVPAHTLSVAYGFSDYHGKDDTWDKLDYDNMARVTRMLALGTAAIANNPERPQWTAVPKAAGYAAKGRALNAAP